jgi:hypothetical protein
MGEIDCAAFDDAVSELVLDLLEPAEHDRLLRHAAGCSRCQSELHSLSAVADLLPSLAPECEPPVGFESRVQALFAPSSPRQRPRPRLLAAAAAAAVLVGGGALVGHALTSDAGARGTAIQSVTTGTLVAADGSERGWVVLANGARPTLTMHLSNLDTGTYRCVIQSADGTTTEVAAWPLDASGAGDWQVAIPADLNARRVVVLEADGTSAASATLTT